MRKRNLLKNVTGKKRNSGIKAFLMVVIFFLGANGLITILTSANTHSFNNKNFEELQNSCKFPKAVKPVSSVNTDLINLNPLNKHFQLRDSLIKEVNEYMDKVTPNNRMNGEYIVDMYLKYNYDISLLLAQAEWETKFGTLGAGRESRNSCFGVMGRKYNSTDEAVLDYIKIMQKSYLPNGRSIAQLFNSGFRTVRGYKYASDSQYPTRIKNTRNKILNKTNIQQLQNEYNGTLKRIDAPI